MPPVITQGSTIQATTPTMTSAASSGTGNVIRNLFNLEMAKASVAIRQTETANVTPQTNSIGVRAGVFIPAASAPLGCSSVSQSSRSNSQSKKSARKSTPVRAGK